MEVFAHLESETWTFEAGDMKPDFGERGFILYKRDILGLRAAAQLYAQVCPVPHLFSGSGTAGLPARGHQGELVTAALRRAVRR